MIMDNEREFFLGKDNLGLQKMQTKLFGSKKMKKDRIKLRDKFNTYHLNLIVNTPSKKVNSDNLRSITKILNKHLRI